MFNANSTRRSFLRDISSAALFGSVITDWGVSPAFSADHDNDYKALVCVFMYGGMDQNEFILPFDPEEYQNLYAARPELFAAHAKQEFGHSRDLPSLLPLTPIDDNATEGRKYALPKELSKLRDMFDEEDLLFVGSVGPLIEPTNRISYETKSVSLPPALFSHNDQQNYWQGLAPEGAKVGWGGRFVDSLHQKGQLGDEELFASISTAGNNLFLAGNKIPVFQVGSDKIDGAILEDHKYLLGQGEEMDAVRTRIASYFRKPISKAKHILASDAFTLQSRALETVDLFRSTYNNQSSFFTNFPEGLFGNQFKQVANAIRASRTLGARRQIFFIGVGGFDTHSNQAEDLPWRQESLATGLRAFSNAMNEVSLWNNVTVFSGAEFGRTLIANGSGTDHGWGAHHFVAGGSVRGKRLVGRMPQYNPAGLEYTESRGRLIPSISIEQYSASLGKWIGLDDDATHDTLPNLVNFGSQDLDLFNA